MGKKREQKVTSNWVHVDDINSTAPAADVTLASVIAFRNGLAKRIEAKTSKPGTVIATAEWRAMMDLDYLARLLDSERRNSTVTMTYIITPTDKKSARKMAAEKKAAARRS